MVFHTYPIFNIHQQISRATQDRQAATPVPPLPLLGGCCNKTHPPASLDPKNRIIKDVSQGWLSTSETTSDDTGYVNIFYHPSRTTTRALIHSFIHWSKPPEGIQSNPPYPSLSSMAPGHTPFTPPPAPFFFSTSAGDLPFRASPPIVSSTQPPLPPTTHPLTANQPQDVS